MATARTASVTARERAPQRLKLGRSAHIASLPARAMLRLKLCRSARIATLLLVIAAGAAAQTPGTPLVATRNPRNRPDPLPTASIESGAYHTRIGWVAPIAARVAVDIARFGMAAGFGYLAPLEDQAQNGIGAGITVGHDLWQPGATGFFSFAGRALVGAAWTRFADTDGLHWVDVPIVVALTHEYQPLEFTILPWIAPRAQLRMITLADDAEVRVLSGASAGIELVKSRCPPATTCVYGWGARLGLELIDDIGGGPLEGGVTLGFVWKFF